MTQEEVDKLYQEHGYASDPFMLLIGATEELGELAGAIIRTHPMYVARKPHQDSIEHELRDVLVYLYGVASVYGIRIADLPVSGGLR